MLFDDLLMARESVVATIGRIMACSDENADVTGALRRKGDLGDSLLSLLFSRLSLLRVQMLCDRERIESFGGPDKATVPVLSRCWH
jgi:hypothetical protein